MGVRMIVLLILMVGIIIGLKWFPLKWKRWNERVQIITTAVLIFTMGVSLGSKPNFIRELRTLGWNSLVLAIIPITFSILLVFVLTKRFMKK